MQAQVLADPRVLEPTPHQDGGRVDRAARDDDRLPRSDDRKRAVLHLDESADAALARCGGSEVGQVGAVGCR